MSSNASWYVLRTSANTKAIQRNLRACAWIKYEGITYEIYQCRNSYSRIVQWGINVEQQVTKPNSEIQLKPLASIWGLAFIFYKVLNTPGLLYNRGRWIFECGFYSRKDSTMLLRIKIISRDWLIKQVQYTFFNQDAMKTIGNMYILID